MKTRLLFLFLLIVFVYNTKGYATIPLYFEDNHAGSFYFFSKNLNLDKSYTILLFDKHSDSGQVIDSDLIRQQLRHSKTNKKALFDKWREMGLIQCSNWIEPLMPKPFADVIWVAGDNLTNQSILEKTNEIKREINSHTQTFLRRSGDLSRRFRVTDFNRLKVIHQFDRPLVISIDLDYFANMKSDEIPKQFRKIAEYVYSLDNIQAISFSISYPHLKSKAQADLLVFNIFKIFFNIINVQINYEPFINNGPDRSKKAAEFFQRRQQVPKYDIATAFDSLKSLILQNERNIEVNTNYTAWKKTLTNWKQEIHNPTLVIFDRNKKLPNIDNRFYIQDGFIIKIEYDKSDHPEISWYLVKPRNKSYNITGTKYEFATYAPTLVRYVESELKYLKGKNLAAQVDLEHLFYKRRMGTVRIFAELYIRGERYRTNIITLTRQNDATYIGRLTEQCNLPYILGSSKIKRDGHAGADALYGADCSNFIIYGKRQQNKDIPYCNPRQLLPYLIEINNDVEVKKTLNLSKDVKVSKWLIEDGLLFHFGSHIVAVYEDNEPKGILDGNDLVLHQLDGFPEIIPLRLLKTSKSAFNVMRFR